MNRTASNPRALSMKLDWLRTLLPVGRRPSEHDTAVLGVTSSDRERKALKEIAARSRWQLRLAGNLIEAEKHLQAQMIGVILCDRDVPGHDWRDHLASLRLCAPGSCVLLVSSVNDDYLWDEVIRNGGHDVLTKPLQATQVVAAVTLAWSYWKQYSAKK